MSEWNLPEDFLEDMRGLLDDEEYQKFIKSYDEPAYKGLRINTRIVSDELRDEIIERFKLKNIPWVSEGYYYNQDAYAPGGEVLHEAGAYYIQEPSAMAPASFIDIEDGDRVLDLCAAPGGKSTQLLAKLGKGLLISNEIVASRAQILYENLTRFGAKNSLVTNESPDRLSVRFPLFFDNIIVDAPCSGEGMFKKNDNAISEWSRENVAICAARQDDILDSAYLMLRAGGEMVYSTCTFAYEENEGSIKRFLARHDDMELVSLPELNGMIVGDEGIGLRLYPHRLKGEGHFVAKLRKSGALDVQSSLLGDQEYAGTIDRSKKKSRANSSKKSRGRGGELIDYELIWKVLSTIASEEFVSYIQSRECVEFKNKIYLLPTDIAGVDGLKVISAGLCLGEFKKNNFSPDHALAKAIDYQDATEPIELSEESAKKFISGQLLEPKDLLDKDISDGWHVVYLHQIALGWVKVTGGRCKNHYPKVLRRLN